MQTFTMTHDELHAYLENLPDGVVVHITGSGEPTTAPMNKAVPDPSTAFTKEVISNAADNRTTAAETGRLNAYKTKIQKV